MKLPNAGATVIDERKVRDYLLSKAHPIGRFKASFFARAGFDAEFPVHSWGHAEEAPRLVTVYPRLS